MTTDKKQHNIGLVLMSLTAVVWGAGFVIGNKLLGNGFAQAPITLNTIRFTFGALVLLAVFGKRLRLDKSSLILGSICGALLCIGFNLQLLGLNVSKSPTECGFFTAAYSVFTPFIAWIFYKRRPTWMMLVGVAVACAGLVILNIQNLNIVANMDVFWGNMITLLGSLFFAVQIVLGDYSLHKKKLDMITLTVMQVVVCAILMCLASLIFESREYATLQIDWSAAWWQLLIVAVFGTAFAYFAQTYAQQHISPTEISILMACESPIGAVLAISIGDDKLTWAVCVGGTLVIASVVLIEILPHIANKRKNKLSADADNTEQQNDATTQQNEGSAE